MGHLKLFWVLLLFSKICLATQETVSVLINLDGKCEDNSTEGSALFYPPSRAFQSLNFYLSEVNASLVPETCCCSNNSITCGTNSTRDTLSPFFKHIYKYQGYILAGTYIANISLLNPSDHMNELCSGKTNFGDPGNYTIHHTNYTATMSRGPTTGQTPGYPGTYSSNHTNYTATMSPGPTTVQTPRTQPQVGDPQNRVAAAVGGTLGALGALGVLLPLSYYMYKRLKKSNQVDDTNSTTDLFGATPVVGFDEAPNSVAPAGTG